MKFAIFATVTILLLISQQSHAAVTEDFINGVGQVPPYNGFWYICSEERTDYVSYALRVFKNTTEVEPDPDFGETLEGDGLNPEEAERIEPSVITVLFTEKNFELMVQGADTYEFVPSLSCYPDFVRKCDMDTGEEELAPVEKYCLAMMNPSSQPANFNITISWSISIFAAEKNQSTSELPESTSDLSDSTSGPPESMSVPTIATGNRILLTVLMLGLVAFTFIGM